MNRNRLRLGVYALSCCCGCQAVLLDGEGLLLELAGRFDIVHFAAIGPCAPDLFGDDPMTQAEALGIAAHGPHRGRE